MKIQKITRGLGWFSLALGAAEMFASRRLNSGFRVRSSREGLVRGLGARRIAAGLGILATRGARRRWLWEPVAAGALELALGKAMRSSRKRTRKRMMVGAALATVAAATALNIWSAARLSRESAAPAM